MLTRILSIIRKEFIQIRRDPRTLALVVAMPAMQLILFGYAVNTVVDHLPTVVVDESQTIGSRSFVERFRNSGYFDVVRRARSRAEALAEIDAGMAKVGIVIPSDFGN